MTSTLADPADDSGTPLAGVRVGPYVLLDRLGRGGMGEVFLGRDTRLDRAVALKRLLDTEGAPGDLRARIVREARAAARITHPHVAAVYDVLEDAGRTFIVMEYVQGETLAALLREGPFTPDRTVAIGVQIAGALAAAHASGVVHRDLKPSNVQVTPRGEVKILDFGIATALASMATTRTATAPGMPADVAGTPPYMSPEQLLGGPVDERSDLYSLAILLFEMATGRRPFAAADRAPAPRRTAPRADQIDPRVPRALADVIDRALAPDPAARYQSAADMGEALRALTAGGRADIALPAVQPPPAAALLRRGLLACAAAATVWILGWVSSAAFNTTLGRAGAFAAEPPLHYMAWGGKSLVAPMLYAAAAVVLGRSAVVALWLLARADPRGRLRARLAPRGRAASRILDDPQALAQALAVAGAAAIAASAWRFSSLIEAWSTRVAFGPPEVLWRLGPGNEREVILYRAVLTVLFVVLGAGLLRVARLRARQRVRGQPAGLLALGIVVGAILLLIEAPYRILWHNRALRADYGGARCYVIGSTDRESLLFCPDLPPARNRIVRAGDPALRPSGIVESIFTPPPPRR